MFLEDFLLIHPKFVVFTHPHYRQMIAAHDKHSLVAIYVQPTDRIDIQTRQYNKTPRAASATLTILLLCVFVCDLVIYVRRAASSYIYVYIWRRANCSFVYCCYCDDGDANVSLAHLWYCLVNTSIVQSALSEND